MGDIATTRMSSKGQIVIPEEIRTRLGLKAGSQFVVIGEDDTVILKAVHAPDMSDFDRLISGARKQAKEAGMKRADVTEAVKDVRKKK